MENSPCFVVETIITTSTTYDNNGNNTFINYVYIYYSFSEIPKDVKDKSNSEIQIQNIKLNNNIYYNPKYNHLIIDEYTNTNYNPWRFGTGILG